MTTSNYDKAFKQLKAKPTKLKKYIKHNKPKERSCGKANKKCRITGRTAGVLGQYGLNLCRQQFRQIADKIGFKKYN